MQGQGIGLLVPMSPQEDAETAGVEWYDGGIGFAVPMEDIYRVLPRLKAGETLMPGLMGSASPTSVRWQAKPEVDQVRPESPGAKAGLKVGTSSSTSTATRRSGSRLWAALSREQERRRDDPRGRPPRRRVDHGRDQAGRCPAAV